MHSLIWRGISLSISGVARKRDACKLRNNGQLFSRTLFLEYLANGQNILFLDPRAGAGLAEPSLTFASGLDLAMCGFTFITHSILGNG